MKMDPENLKEKAREFCTASLVPNDGHPFDHLIVFSQIVIEKPLRIDSWEYRKLFKPEDLTKEDI